MHRKVKIPENQAPGSPTEEGMQKPFGQVKATGKVENICNGNPEVKVFNEKEEMVLHQENRNVKTVLVSKIDRKRVFNSQDRR